MSCCVPCYTCDVCRAPLPPFVLTICCCVPWGSHFGGFIFQVVVVATVDDDDEVSVHIVIAAAVVVFFAHAPTSHPAECCT